MESEHIYFNALSVDLRGNYSALKKLLESFNNWQTAFKNTPTKINPEKEWLRLEKLGIKLLLATDPNFPKSLKEIPWPPFAIYHQGQLPNEDLPRLAIVGTRKSSTLSRTWSEMFSKKLSQSGVQIISGLALGVDTSAHEGCLAGPSPTFAVLALGLDNVYPSQNHRLAKKIVSNAGGIISEYPPTVGAQKHFFIQRNRLVSGLSQGVLVIEAPERSGSLATARFAEEQNKELFVLPGPVNNANFKGSNKLIQDGAFLTTSPDEILEVLGVKKESNSSIDKEPRFDKLSKTQKIIISALKNESHPLHVDELQKITKLETSTLLEEITELGLAGIIQEEAGRYYIK